MSLPSLQHRLFDYVVAPVEHVAMQLPRALVVSVLAAALDFGLLVLLVECGHWPKLAAATVSYLLGGVVQYILCSCWVFSINPGNTVIGFTTFTLLSLVGLGITNGVISLGGHWHIDYRLAKVAALGLAFCWNFTSRRYLIFRRRVKA